MQLRNACLPCQSSWSSYFQFCPDRAFCTGRSAILIEWHEPYLSRFGTRPEAILQVANRFGYHLFTIPGGVPVTDAASLAVQMLSCQNFLLVPKGRR